MGRFIKGCAIGCGVLVVIAVIGGLAVAAWVRATFKPKPPDPTVGPVVALRPTFKLRAGGDYGAGTAVAVRLQPGSQPILLTALHLFGPAGGLETNLAPSQLDGVIREVLLTPVGGRGVVAKARGALRKSGAALQEDDTNVSGDVAAFKLLPKARVNALNLAAGNPRTGEWVWMIGDVFDHEPQTQRLFPAQVLTVSDAGTTVKFQTSFQLRAFSGAPLINARREVVGLLISGGENGGIGIINPAGSIRKRLSESGIR